MKVRLHEYPNGDWCPHCGAHKKAGQGISCLWRDVADPEPSPRTIAADDFDFIRARIEALAAERAGGNEQPIP